MWSGDFPPSPPVHVHREQRQGTRACEMQGFVEEDGAPAYHGPVTPHSLCLYDHAPVSDEKISTPIVT